MDTIFLFDIDGTVTDHSKPICQTFANVFKETLEGERYYFVTGSPLTKVKEQLGDLFLDPEGIFTCLGNQLWRKTLRNKRGPEYYIHESNTATFSRELIAELELFLQDFTFYSRRFGNHIEHRNDCMINFSICGRNIPTELRQEYIDWDNQSNERKRLVSILEPMFPDYDFSLGGKISIDITKKGYDKSQVFDYFNKYFSKWNLVFFGDTMFKGGNDYPLANALINNGHTAIEVSSPDDCLAKLKLYIESNK